jgi:lipopolysaccharide/colanic/teichoic acid biosynthesis glycosyltransferase
MKMLIPTEATRNTEPSATVVKQVSPKSAVLFVGTAIPRQDDELPGYQHWYVTGIQETGTAIAGIRASQQVPAVIIYRFNIGYEDAFTQWKQYFGHHPSHRNIPFFVYADQVSDSLRTFVKKYPFVDEIITRQCLVNHLSEKIAFVNKHKRMQKALMVDQRPRQKRRTSVIALLNKFLKRTFDILVAGLLLTLLLLPFLVIALIIKCQSRGPVFYISQRAGKNYKIFNFYKFRTMVADADKLLDKLKHLNQYDASEKTDGPKFYKVSNDPRVTRFGMFLRNTSIDELPQLFNVLKGDMSLVGNRPLPLYEASTLTTDEWVQRFLGPAGITGLWQISKRGKKDMSAQERIELDINYTQKCSFGYDMWIIASTPKALIQKDNV